MVLLLGSVMVSAVLSVGSRWSVVLSVVSWWSAVSVESVAAEVEETGVLQMVVTRLQAPHTAQPLVLGGASRAGIEEAVSGWLR